MDTLFIFLQYILPQHLLSRLVGFLASTEISWLKNALISTFIGQYNVDMNQALYEKAEDYKSFNEFFTRPLKEGMRPLADSEQFVLNPADGAISQLGDIEQGRIFQAKGQSYSALELLGGDAELAARFNDGKFATIYLSPRDYHRVHMPVAGKLKSTQYIPGDLFSVNQTTAENVPRLFSRNERLVAIFDTAHGEVAMVMVGAMIVAGIETVWGAKGREQPRMLDSFSPAVELAAGDEMGRFYLGSTVVLLFEKDQINWDEALKAGDAVQMGQALATKQ
jgi:phosphatidylserine decarboxylase